MPALLKINQLELPLETLQDSFGTTAIKVSDLHKSNLFLFDPGMQSTAVCNSKITYIDGDKGTLLYRGYAIAELAEHSNFLEVVYILFYGKRPTPEQYASFSDQITHHTMLHEQLQMMYRSFPRDAHPMGIMTAVVGALSVFYHEHISVQDSKDRESVLIRLIAKMPTIVAASYKYALGQSFMAPNNLLDYSSNFLYMMFGTSAEPYEVDPIVAKAMDVLFILHADHEQNVSTTAVRVAGSSGANPFAVVSAGIAALWGPSHGGANEAVIKMLGEIGSKSRIEHYIEKAKDKNDPFKLFGFGHRVYKNYDPRAKVIKEMCDKVLALRDIKDPLLDIALELERIALEDPYFIERKLYPNVDFYSGIIYRALGVPTNMFTPLFALARTAGWLSQWNEMLEDPNQKILRPRQVYSGHNYRRYDEIR